MKRTVIFDVKTKIIKGFGIAQIDPIETREIVDKLMEKSNVVKSLNQKKSSLASIHLACDRAKFDIISVFFQCAKRIEMSDREMNFISSREPKKAFELLNEKERLSLEQHGTTVINRKKDAVDAMKLISADIVQFNVEEKKLIPEKAIYFGPRAGEEIIEDDEFTILTEKISKLRKGKVLKKDGKTIDDPNYITPASSVLEDTN